MSIHRIGILSLDVSSRVVIFICNKLLLTLDFVVIFINKLLLTLDFVFVDLFRSGYLKLERTGVEINGHSPSRYAHAYELIKLLKV